MSNISIVVIAESGESLLPCLEGLVTSGLDDDVELVLFDNGSPDIVLMLPSLEGTIRYRRAPVTLSPAVAQLEATAIATGDVCVFVETWVRPLAGSIDALCQAVRASKTAARACHIDHPELSHPGLWAAPRTLLPSDGAPIALCAARFTTIPVDLPVVVVGPPDPTLEQWLDELHIPMDHRVDSYDALPHQEGLYLQTGVRPPLGLLQALCETSRRSHGGLVAGVLAADAPATVRLRQPTPCWPAVLAVRGGTVDDLQLELRHPCPVDVQQTATVAYRAARAGLDWSQYTTSVAASKREQARSWLWQRVLRVIDIVADTTIGELLCLLDALARSQPIAAFEAAHRLAAIVALAEDDGWQADVLAHGPQVTYDLTPPVLSSAPKVVPPFSRGGTLVVADDAKVAAQLAATHTDAYCVAFGGSLPRDTPGVVVAVPNRDFAAACDHDFEKVVYASDELASRCGAVVRRVLDLRV